MYDFLCLLVRRLARARSRSLSRSRSRSLSRSRSRSLSRSLSGFRSIRYRIESVIDITRSLIYDAMIDHYTCIIYCVYVPVSLSLVYSGQTHRVPFTTIFDATDCCTSIAFVHRNNTAASVSYQIDASLVYELARAQATSAPLATARVSIFEPFTARMHPLVTDQSESFLFSRGELHSTLSLPRQVYHMGDCIQATLRIRNSTNREIKAVCLRVDRILCLRLASMSSAFQSPNSPITTVPSTRQIDSSMLS